MGQQIVAVQEMMELSGITPLWLVVTSFLKHMVVAVVLKAQALRVEVLAVGVAAQALSE
jgi:hypothetical protein